MLLKISNLDKTIKIANKKDLDIIDNVSFMLPSNKILAIIGESGSGKSTLAKMIAGFTIPSWGSINYNYRYLTTKNSKYKNLAPIRKFSKITFQDTTLQFFKKTVWDEILFGFENLNYRDEKLIKNANKVFKFLEFDDKYKDVNPNNLSGGEQKKLLLSIIAFFPSKLLILDEPTANLDHYNRIEVLNFIKKINQKNKTIIMITHDLKNLEISDYILFLRKGKQKGYLKTDFFLKQSEAFRNNLLAKINLI